MNPIGLPNFFTGKAMARRSGGTHFRAGGSDISKYDLQLILLFRPWVQNDGPAPRTHRKDNAIRIAPVEVRKGEGAAQDLWPTREDDNLGII